MILFPKARRRHPGVYIFRTRRHFGWGTEVGYVGKSNHLALRKAQHEAKPWADLVTSYHALRLPWWLGWQWITLSIETIVILILRPRYNWQKNPRRSKVGPRDQMLQRAARDRSQHLGRRNASAHLTDLAFRFGGAAVIVTGLLGWFITR